MQAKKSGDSLDDFIVYVRRRMYIQKKKPNELGNWGENEEEDDTVDNTCDNMDKTNEKEEENEIDKVTPENDAKKYNSGNNNDGVNDTIPIASESSLSSIDIPDNYLFPSFFVFIRWGPYAPTDNRLNTNLITDTSKPKSAS